MTLELVPELIFTAVMNNELSTGDVARACGVSPDTIRYYERCGAFAGRRMANGYRRFPPEKGCWVARLLGCWRAQQLSDPATQQLFDRRIADMIALREQLAAILTDWDVRLAKTTEGEAAHLLESLERSPS